MPRSADDLTGNVYGWLRVISRAPSVNTRNARRNARWHCVCGYCGTQTVVRADNLKAGTAKSCGCRGATIVGRTFGALTVIARDESQLDRAYWLCRCASCGSVRSVRSDVVRKGRKCEPCRSGKAES